MLPILLVLLFSQSIVESRDVVVGKSASATHIVNGTDAYPILTQAIADVNATGGGVIHIEPGTYSLSRNIILGANMTLMGSGMDVTVLQLVNNANAWSDGKNKRAGFIRARLDDNISIRDMTLDGNKQKQKKDDLSLYGRYGIFTEGSANVFIDRVKIKNFQGYGFDPHGWKAGKIYGKNLTITNCVAIDNDWDGFTLDQTVGMVIRNNTAIHNGRHGFNVVTGSKMAVLEGNYAYDNGHYYNHGPDAGSGCGIMVQNNQKYGTGQVVIKSNYLKGSLKGGVCLNDVFNITVQGNMITGTNTSCMLITAVKGASVVDNICVGLPPTTSIRQVSSKQVVLSNNTFPDIEPPWTTPSPPPPVEQPIPSPIPSPSPSPPTTPSPSPISPLPSNGAIGVTNVAMFLKVCLAMLSLTALYL
jgi:Right handed beta helix region